VTRCLLGRSQDGADGRASCRGAVLRSNGLTPCGCGCGGAVAGYGGMGGGGGGGGDSRRRTRDAVCSDWARSLSIDALAVDFQASSPESLSSTLVNAASNLSNFFARSSMEVVIKASNLVHLHDGARLKDSRCGEKNLVEKALNTNCYDLEYLEKRSERIG